MRKPIPLQKAEVLNDVYKSLKSEPLQIDELDEFYVDTYIGREENQVKGLERNLLRNLNENSKILFSGYRGCGKSTELNKLAHKISDSYYTISFSVFDELDALSLSHIDIIIAILEQLLNFVQKENIRVSPDYLNLANAWFNSQEVRKVIEFRTSAEIENSPFSMLLKSVGSLKSSVKMGGDYKRVVTETIDKKLSDLIEVTNALINDINLKILGSSKDRLLIIIEDLDKLDLPRAEDLFANYASILTRINTNIIFTFPISLCYHRLFNVIRSYFDSIVELTMIKVKNKNGSVNDEGINVLYKIIEKRLDVSLFEEDIIKGFIIKSGGCIRDLFRMLDLAANSALDWERAKITKTDYCKAYWRIRDDYKRSLSAYKTEDGEIITEQDYEEILISVAKSNDAPRNRAALDLRHNLSILSYYGSYWYDIHPVLRDALIDAQKLDKDEADFFKCEH